MNNFEILFLSIAISVGVFLLLREVFCWYFKINKRLSVLVDIKAELVKMNEPKALVGGFNPVGPVTVSAEGTMSSVHGGSGTMGGVGGDGSHIGNGMESK
jgi:hypothetical protein